MSNFLDKYVDGRSLEQAIADIYKTLNLNKLNTTSNNLQTESKNVIDAINEVLSKIGQGGDGHRIKLENNTNIDTITEEGRYYSDDMSFKFTGLPWVDNGYTPYFELEVKHELFQEGLYYVYQIITASTQKWVRLGVKSGGNVSIAGHIWYPLTLINGGITAIDTLQGKTEKPTGVYVPITSDDTDVKIYTPKAGSRYKYELIEYVTQNISKLLADVSALDIEFKALSNNNYCLKLNNGFMILYGIYRSTWLASSSTSTFTINLPLSFINNDVVVSAHMWKNVNAGEGNFSHNIFDLTCTSNSSKITIVVKSDENSQFQMDTSDGSEDGVRWIAMGRWK